MGRFLNLIRRPEMMELRCSHDLALWLGAIEPQNIGHHRALRAGAASLMVRDPVTLLVMFWPLVSGSEITLSSS